MSRTRDLDDPAVSRMIMDRLAVVVGETAPRRAQPLPESPESGAAASGPRDRPPEAVPPEPVGRDLQSRRDEVDLMTESDELSVVQDRGFSFSRAHLSVVGALIIVGLLFAGWAILRARPVALATPLPVEATTTAPRSPSSPTEGSATPAAEIMVHVLGAVRQPGVVTLPDRARVRDAIERAGGLRRTADPSDLNLAQVLVDGQQLVIGTEDRPEGTVRDGSAPVAGGPPSAGTSVTTVDLNTATEAQLDQLPGVGPVTAERILAWRAEQGRFTRVEELQEVDGIGPKTYAQIAPLVRV